MLPLGRTFRRPLLASVQVLVDDDVVVARVVVPTLRRRTGVANARHNLSGCLDEGTWRHRTDRNRDVVNLEDYEMGSLG